MGCRRTEKSKIIPRFFFFFWLGSLLAIYFVEENWRRSKFFRGEITNLSRNVKQRVNCVSRTFGEKSGQELQVWTPPYMDGISTRRWVALPRQSVDGEEKNSGLNPGSFHVGSLSTESEKETEEEQPVKQEEHQQVRVHASQEKAVFEGGHGLA